MLDGPPRRRAVCPHDCPSTCALGVEHVDAETIGRLYGAADHSYTLGVICEKVARYAERVHHPDRLTTPLLRRGAKGDPDGFVPIRWDEALDRTAEGLKTAAAQEGAEAVWPYYYAGTMGHVQRDGINRLRHVMGYARQDRTICVALSDAGWKAGAGTKRGADARDMAQADVIILWGCNAASTQIHALTHAQKARKARGAKIICVDPYRNRTAAAADWHLPVRPGTDGALACAVMAALFEAGLADRAWMARHADDAAGLEAHLRPRTPEWAAAICGVSAGDIRALARLIGETKRVFLRIGYGLSRSRNGAAQMHAVASIAAVAGLWGHPGGGALYGQSDIYGLDKTLIEGLDRRDPATRLLDMSRIGPILHGADIGAGPPVRALFIQNTNPIVVAPESALVRSGFGRDDLFVCVHEQFMTETAAMADIVLPATTFLEHDDLYTASGHTDIAVSAALIPPVGEARSNHDVLCGLAERLGARHPGFETDARGLIEATLHASGLPDFETLRAGHDCAGRMGDHNFTDGFGHPDGRFHFRADWAALGADGARMPVWPDHWDVIEAGDEATPLRLVTAPSHSFLNSSFTETPTSRKKSIRPTVFAHEDDLVALGVGDGDRVALSNARGRVLVHAQARPGQQRGVVVVEGLWPNAAFENGQGINTLVGAERCAPNGGAAFHDVAVRMEKVE